MLNASTPLLFESTDNHRVFSDPVNQPWLAVVNSISGESFDVLARRYYLALTHLRSKGARPTLVGKLHVIADGAKQAAQGMLDLLIHRKSKPESERIFVEAAADEKDSTLPRPLKDWNIPPPRLSVLLQGPGRPPADALCLMRAFLAAPVLGMADSPSEVHLLLHSNPTFAHACGFLGSDVYKQPGEWTSRRLPSLSVCEEFSEVMTRYGLWQLARVEKVRENIDSRLVETEDTLAFDTTHIEANSHCANIIPGDAPVQEGKKPKHRKVPRMRKHCDCGKSAWETCEHAWSPTDSGAAVVVKGTSRIYWAHKVSVVSFGHSEIPIDARVLNYAAQSDGKPSCRT